MARHFPIVLAALVAMFFQDTLVQAQVRVTPAQARGGEKQGAPWAKCPNPFAA